MSLRTRLLLTGALLPVALLLASVVVAGLLFDYLLLSTIDEGMRTQAAVESASLFDGPDGRPHVHLRGSSLDWAAEASAIAVYDEEGTLVAHYPDDRSRLPERLRPTDLRGGGAHTAVDAQGERIRELRVGITSPSGARYAVWLGHALAHHDATVRIYYQSSLLVLGLVAVLLFSIQLVHANRLHGRIDGLVRHMDRLREGDLDTRPPADDMQDELRRLRDAVAEATEHLRSARSARERLVADAAHELRTPLATMRAAVEVTLRRDRTVEELRETLGHVHEEVERLTELSSALLDLAGLRAREPEHVELHLASVVRKAIDSARAAAASRDVTLDLEQQVEGRTHGSPREIRQALDNLLANAIHHAPEGSRIRITLTEEGRYARLVVRDQGPGIPEGEREAVFEPFHRVASAGTDGTGLGLAIVHAVAKRHGGRTFVLDDGEPGTAIGFDVALA